MTLKELSLKYILKSERVFNGMKILQGPMHISEENVKEVIEEAKRYFEDAKFYLGKEKLETSLASIAYCEGLLDALRMLGFVEFSW